MTGIMQISGRETENIEAIALVESFTTLACTFLIVTPPHIEDVCNYPGLIGPSVCM